MNKILLKFVMLFKGIFRSMGADVEQLEIILATKLKMDDRRPLSFGRQRQNKKEMKHATWLNMFFSLITGLIYIFVLLAFKDRVTSLFMYFTAFLFLLTFSLITDFSNMLFDAKDKYVLLPRPVNDKTIFLSRTLHTFIYLLRVVIPMSLPGWITLGIRDGWQSALLFPLPLILMVFMALFLVNACYLLILKLVKPEKFKEVINYFQIIFSIVIFGMYYILPRMLNTADIENMNVFLYPAAKFFPSYWLASFWFWIIPGTAGAVKWLSVLAIVLPLVCLWLTVKWLAPSFAARISAVDSAGVTENRSQVSRKTKGKPLYSKYADLLNRNDTVKAGFLITWLQTSRSRSFKMKIYPTFAYVPIYFVFMFIQKDGSLAESFQQLPEKKSRLFILLYMSGFVLSQAITFVTLSEQYKAAWVYYASPINKPGSIMIGAFKAVWVKYFLPFYLAISAFVIYIWGAGVIPDLLLALMNVSLFSLIVLRVGYRQFPFSTPEHMKNAGGKTTIRLFLTMAIIGGLGFGHYFAATVLPWLRFVFMSLSGVLLWLVWDSYAGTKWEAMKTSGD